MAEYLKLTVSLMCARLRSLKGGGLGIRYTCRIRGKQVYLFDEEGKWFVERK
jgi:hypothetical protein